MKTICKHTYPSDLCGICNPPAKKKADGLSDATPEMDAAAYEAKARVMDRLQPYQKAMVAAPKYSAIKGARKAANASPWRHIGELGEIAYMEDGSRRWTLKGDWEMMKIFLVYMANGDVQTHFAYIDGDDGMLRDCNGDDVGWLWCDAEYFMDVPARPYLHNADVEARRP